MERVSRRHFLHGSWRKTFVLLYSINWTNFIVYLPLLGEILSNICIAVICEPGCYVLKFEINLIVLIMEI